VRGATDPALNLDASTWFRVWINGRSTAPPFPEWPAAEAHLDLHTGTSVNQVSIHQTLGPTTYTWGYLAATTFAPPPSGLGR
jgi:endoglucanase